MVTRRIPLKPRRVRLLVEDAEKVRQGKLRFGNYICFSDIRHEMFLVFTVNTFVFLEPLSKLLKNAKQNAANMDGEKVKYKNKDSYIFCRFYHIICSVGFLVLIL